MKKILLISLVALVLVGCAQVTKVEKDTADSVQKPEIKVEEAAKKSLAEQMPLSCPPSGETAQSRMTQIDGNRGGSVEFYLACGDMNWRYSKHVFFTEPTGPGEKEEKVFYYSFGSGGLEWQIKDGEIHQLTTKNDLRPGTMLDGFGADYPGKVLDFMLDGKELNVLKEPISFKDISLGDFQDAKFELKNFGGGVLTIGGKKFEINLEKGGVKEV